MPTTRHKPLSLYPKWCVDVLSKFAAGAVYEQILVGDDRRAAQSAAHMFNRARLAYCRELATADPQAVERVLDAICRITNLAPGADTIGHGGVKGKYLLEFTTRGMAVLADELAGVESKFKLPEPNVPGLEREPAFPRETVEKAMKTMTTPQNFEREIESWVRKPKAQEATPATTPDETDPARIAFQQGQEKLAKEEAERARSCPPHEWDKTETRCLKCGAPKPEEPRPQ